MDGTSCPAYLLRMPMPPDPRSASQAPPPHDPRMGPPPRASALKSLLTLGGLIPEGQAKEVLYRAAAMAFHKCGIEGCEAHSLGLVCSQCSRFACQSHVYLTASMPPTPVCARCIAQEFMDMSGAAGEAATPKARRPK